MGVFLEALGVRTCLGRGIGGESMIGGVNGGIFSKRGGFCVKRAVSLL